VRAAIRPALRRGALDATIALALAAAAWALYAPVLRLWWTHDDFFNLRFLLTRPPFWYFLDASAFRDHGGGMLPPLLFASLDLDRRAFGLDPRPFYVHQLVSLAAFAAALYGAARPWLARPWALVAAWTVLIGPVTGSLATMLMVRHYVEASLLAALSTMAWAAALRRPGRAGAGRLAWLSAALYLGACLAKEVAVPLGALLPLLPAPGSRTVGGRARMRLALPHAVALVVYLALRYAVVGGSVTPYGFAVRSQDVPALALELPVKVAAEFSGGRASVAAVVFALAIAAGVVPIVAGRRRAAIVVGGASLLALLVVLPVSTRLEPRYALAAWVVVAVAFAAGCGTLAARRRAVAVALAVVAGVSGLWLNREDWRVRFAAAERMSAEHRFLLEAGAGDVLRRPLAPGASLGELLWLKETVYRRPGGGRWFRDDLFLCLHPDPLGRVWGYDPGARGVVDVTARLPTLRERHCAAIRAEAPLSASFRVAGTSLFWDLGPHRVGAYGFVFDDGGDAVEMPRTAGFQLRGRPAVALRVRYESPAGWITYSPVLHLRVVDGFGLHWSRP
jgi:hypothetical protein